MLSIGNLIHLDVSLSKSFTDRVVQTFWRATMHFSQVELWCPSRTRKFHRVFEQHKTDSDCPHSRIINFIEWHRDLLNQIQVKVVDMNIARLRSKSFLLPGSKISLVNKFKFSSKRKPYAAYDSFYRLNK
jgi:hypothetical protein